MFSLFLGTQEKIGNTETAKGTALRSLNLNTHVHTVCKKGISKKRQPRSQGGKMREPGNEAETTDDQNPFTGNYL